MNIIEMAKAHLVRDEHTEFGWQECHKYSFDEAELSEFAALVAAHERKACAKLVEPDEEHRRNASWGYLGGAEGVDLLDAKVAAIRARGTT